LSITIKQSDHTLTDKDLEDAWLVFGSLHIKRNALDDASKEVFDYILGCLLRSKPSATIDEYQGRYLGGSYIMREKDTGVIFQVNLNACPAIGGGLRDIEAYDA